LRYRYPTFGALFLLAVAIAILVTRPQTSSDWLVHSSGCGGDDAYWVEVEALQCNENRWYKHWFYENCTDHNSWECWERMRSEDTKKGLEYQIVTKYFEAHGISVLEIRSGTTAPNLTVPAVCGGPAGKFQFLVCRHTKHTLEQWGFRTLQSPDELVTANITDLGQKPK